MATATTTTATLTGLEGLLGELGLETPVPQFPGADVLAKPVDIYRAYTASLLAEALGADAGTVYEAIQSTNDISLGDLAVIIPRLKLDAEAVKNLSLDLRTKLPASPLFEAPFVDGVHLRFFTSPKVLARLLLRYIADRGPAYGHEPSLGLRDPADPGKGRKKVVVEFSSPNIATGFTDEYLRSTILGAFVANMYECMGWDVVRLNYLGDWGKQIGLMAVGWERYGSEEALASGPDPLGHLLEVSARIDEDFRPELAASRRAKEEGLSTAEIEGRGIFAARDAFFKRMEEGDAEALALWRRFRDVTIADLTAAYGRLGIRFDEYAGESQVRPETVAEVEAALKEKGVLEESAGSWVLDFAKHTGRRGLGTAVVRGRTGASTYLLRHIAAAVDRERADGGFDRAVYVASARLDSHFAQVFAALDLLGRPDLRERLQHVGFGRIQGLAEHLHLGDGAGALSLGAILDRCARLMQDDMAAAEAAGEGEGGDANGNGQAPHPVPTAAVGDIAAVSAILAQDMSGRRGHPSVFDPKRMTSFDAETGLKLQVYHAQVSGAVAALRSELGIATGSSDEEAAAAAAAAAAHPAGDEETADYEAVFQQEQSADMLRLLAQFPGVAASTFRSLEPHTLLTHLFRVGDSVAVLLSGPSEDGGEEEDEAKVKEEEEKGGEEEKKEEQTVGEKKARLALYDSARQVLENGMRMLGFPIVAH